MLNGQEIAIAPLFLFHIHLTKEISSVFFLKKKILFYVIFSNGIISVVNNNINYN